MLLIHTYKEKSDSIIVVDDGSGWIHYYIVSHGIAMKKRVDCGYTHLHDCGEQAT